MGVKIKVISMITKTADENFILKFKKWTRLRNIKINTGMTQKHSSAKNVSNNLKSNSDNTEFKS
jgi:hypothetical protein